MLSDSSETNVFNTGRILRAVEADELIFQKLFECFIQLNHEERILLRPLISIEFFLEMSCIK